MGFRSDTIYKKAYLEEVDGKEAVVIEVQPRKNSPPVCRVCMKRCGTHSTGRPRRFEHVPFWGWQVYLQYRPRRTDCPVDGVWVECLPWAVGKERKTRTYQVFLARWARRLSWVETARVFCTSWNSVARAVAFVVGYGLAHRQMDGIEAIGVDEIHVQRNLFLTLVYQLDPHSRRLLWSGQKRRMKTLLRFFHEFGKARSAQLKFVCTDMWAPYLKVIKKKAPQAINVLDRFHIIKHINEAIDRVRRAETRQYKGTNKERLLTRSRWPLLKNKVNLTESQVVKLKVLLTAFFVSVFMISRSTDTDSSAPCCVGRHCQG